MNKRIFALVLALALLSGCTLATDETRQDETGMQDKLVGVVVTIEYLDLFDMDAWLADNADSLVDGGTLTVDEGEAAKYQNRIYAVMDEEGGYRFPGVDGIYLCQMWKEDHWSSFATEGFCQVHSKVNCSDTTDSIEQTATIYVPSDTKEAFFVSNPVYMTPDGEYYLVTGNGLSSEYIELSTMTQSICDEQTMTDSEGNEQVYSARFEISMTGVDVAERVVFIQMSADHQELSRAEYTPDTMPETIDPDEGSAYIIVEQYTGESITRTLNQPGSDKIEVFARTEKVYCIPVYTEVNWPE